MYCPPPPFWVTDRLWSHLSNLILIFFRKSIANDANIRIRYLHDPSFYRAPSPF